jgi:periplasmic protein TonB
VDGHDGGAVDVTRGADAVALAVSGAVHGAILAVAFVLAWPGQSPPAVMPVELVEAILDSPTPPPARLVEPRRQLARFASRPAEPVQAPPPRPEPSGETPAAPTPSPPATAPETPMPETRAEAPVATGAEPPPPAPSIAALSARRDATPATAVRAVEPTGEVSTAVRAEPEGVAAPPPSIAAVPPGAPAERITEAARPRGGYQVRPPYPAVARQARAEGTTMLRVHIAADGSIAEVQVQRSAGHAALDEAAAAAVRKWRFEPARSGSAAVAVWVVIPVEFRLKGDF